MAENQQTITAWADETFGRVADPIHAIKRARDEMCEFMDLPKSANPKEIMEEAADIVITLYRLASVLGGNLHDEIDGKMAINRYSRRWKPDGTGNGQHIKD